MQVRNAVLRSLQSIRYNKKDKDIANKIGHNLEGKVVLFYDQSSKDGTLVHNFLKRLSNAEEFLKDFFIVSEVVLAKSSDDLVQDVSLPWLYLKSMHASGSKCPRCWRWSNSTFKEHVCARCVDALKQCNKLPI